MPLFVSIGSLLPCMGNMNNLSFPKSKSSHTILNEEGKCQQQEGYDFLGEWIGGFIRKEEDNAMLLTVILCPVHTLTGPCNGPLYLFVSFAAMSFTS